MSTVIAVTIEAVPFDDINYALNFSSGLTQYLEANTGPPYPGGFSISSPTLATPIYPWKSVIAGAPIIIKNTAGIVSAEPTQYWKLYMSLETYGFLFEMTAKQGSTDYTFATPTWIGTKPTSWTTYSGTSSKFELNSTLQPFSTGKVAAIGLTFPSDAIYTIIVQLAGNIGIQGIAASNTAMPANCIMGEVEVLTSTGKYVPIKDLGGRVSVSGINADGLVTDIDAVVVQRPGHIFSKCVEVTDNIACSSDHVLFKHRTLTDATPYIPHCELCAPASIPGLSSVLLKHSEDHQVLVRTVPMWYHLVPIDPVHNGSVFALKDGYYSEFFRTPLEEVISDGWEEVNTILPYARISRDVCVLVDGKWVEIGNLYGIVQISAIDADGIPKLVYAKVVKSKTRIGKMEVYRIDGVGYFSHNHTLFKEAGANALSTHPMGCSKCCPFVINGYTSAIVCHMSEQVPSIMISDHYWYNIVPINPADSTCIFELKCGYYSEFLCTPISNIMDGNEWVLH
jgi:hypothetical protein